MLARVLGLAAVLVAGGVLVVWGVDLGKRVIEMLDQQDKNQPEYLED